MPPVTSWLQRGAPSLDSDLAFHLAGEQVLIALALMGVGLAYAAWFKSTRGALGFIVFLWLVAGLGYPSLMGLFGFEFQRLPAGLVIQLLPLNLLLVALLPLNALRSPGTIGFIMLLAAQLVLCALKAPPAGVQPVNLGALVLGWLPVQPTDWYPFMIMAVAAAFVLRWVKSDQPNDIALGLIATVFMAWHFFPQRSFEFIMSAGLMLMLAVLYSSNRLAFYDALTGIRNRRSLDAALETVGRRYAIAMLDVDHFKKVNDRFGHDFGDQVLKVVAARVKRVPGFTLFRYGGEEFCMLFKGSRVDGAVDVCELAREAVADGPVAMRSQGRPKHKPLSKGKYRHKVASVKVTVSIGLARPGDSRPKPDMVREAADKALYRAKKNGRNQVAVAR
jgi:diguanylate cyclase (GGDEF)-like protein